MAPEKPVKQGRIAFKTTLEPRGPAAAVVLDEEQVATVGQGAKSFPVKATVNGYSWRGRVSRMRGEFLLGLNKEVRTAAGVEAGEEVEVELQLDAEERTVELPQALALALAADADAKAGFDGLAYSHRKEYARWIDEAKKDETRDRRLAKALEQMREGKPPR